MGVITLPRFAATVSRTITEISVRLSFVPSSPMVKGTKVISATSFVIRAEEKKQIRISRRPVPFVPILLFDTA